MDDPSKELPKFQPEPYTYRHSSFQPTPPMMMHHPSQMNPYMAMFP